LGWTQLLLDESEEDRDDDTGFCGLAEDDEEDRDCENVDHFGGGRRSEVSDFRII